MKKWLVTGLSIVLAATLAVVPATSSVLDAVPKTASAATKTTQTYMLSTKKTYVRKGASTKNTAVGYIDKKVRVKLKITKGKSWAYFSEKGLKGYVKLADFKDLKRKSSSERESKIITLVNKERKKAGLKPLKENKVMNYTAYYKSKEMAQKNYFGHDGGKYKTWSNLITSHIGINITGMGENIAYGYPSTKEVMIAWMNSKGHRENILNKNFKEMGVGVYYDKSNKRFYWTQHFLTK